jgi:hypothetical protein
MAITNQVKPEELKKKIEAIDAPEPEKAEIEPIQDEEIIETPDVNEEVPEVDNDQEEIEDEAEKRVKPKAKAETDETDYKLRYAGSTREAQVLKAKNKQLVDTVVQAKEMTPPTDEEMAKIYGDDWELMDNVTKRIARENELSTRRFQAIGRTVEETKKIDDWVGKASEFSQDQTTLNKYPVLEGKETEFVQYCMIPSRVDRDLDDLVKSFLHDVKPSVPKRRNLFQAGGGGGEAPKPKGFSVAEVKFMRENQPKEYGRLLKAGKIKVEI